MITQITTIPAARLHVGAHVTAHSHGRDARVNSFGTVHEVAEYEDSPSGIRIILTSSTGERRHLNVTGGHLFYLADPQ